MTTDLDVASLTDHQQLALARMGAGAVDYSLGVLTSLGLQALGDELRHAKDNAESLAWRRDEALEAAGAPAGMLGLLQPTEVDGSLEAAQQRYMAAIQRIDELSNAARAELESKRLFGYGEGI